MTSPKLHDFDGHDVITTSIKVTKAGDGLSAALTVEPQEFSHGDIVYVVLACEVTNIAFTPVKDTQSLNRVHTLSAGQATIVDKKLVAGVLEAQKKKLEEAQGIQRIPGIEGDDE